MKRLLFLSFITLILAACAPENPRQEVPRAWKNEQILPHTRVKSQGRTSTCWAFSMTSFLESELMRMLKGDTVHLSEMYFVRDKYQRQFNRYYYSQGYQALRNGSLGHTCLHTLQCKGLLPRRAYLGVGKDIKQYDHRKLWKNLQKLAEKAVDKKDFSTYNLRLATMLDEQMGALPDTFTYKNRRYTAASFADSMQLQAVNYLELTSFTHHPFHSWFVLEIPDNWEPASYYNVSIDEMEGRVRTALQKGRTVVWDGDTHAKSFDVSRGVADYPVHPVTQEYRQQLFEQFELNDTHMMHIIGSAEDADGTYYYILKNSWGKVGPYQGLLYMSEDYFRAKTISVLLPKDLG